MLMRNLAFWLIFNFIYFLLRCGGRKLSNTFIFIYAGWPAESVALVMATSARSFSHGHQCP